MGAWWGIKSKMFVSALVVPLLFEGSKEPRASQECKELAEKYRLRKGRGRVNPPPRSLVWRFWRFGGLLIGGCIYTPRGTRPQRTAFNYVPWHNACNVYNWRGRHGCMYLNACMDNTMHARMGAEHHIPFSLLSAYAAILPRLSVEVK